MKPENNINKKIFITSIIIFFFILIIKCLQHYTFNTNAYDLTIYDSAISNSLKNNFLYSILLERSLLSEHFSPIMIIFIPLYYIYNSVLWLFIAQATLSSIIFYLCVKISLHYKIDEDNAIFIGLICIFNKRFSQGLMYNFHPEIFAVVLLLLIIYSSIKNKKIWLYIYSILLLLVKEDMALSLIGFLLFYNLKELKKHRIILLFISIIYIYFVVFKLIPYFGHFKDDQSLILLERWKNYGSTRNEILLNLISSPSNILKSSINTYYHTLNTFIFLPLFSLPQLLMSFFYIGLHSTSSLNIESQLKLYYSFGVLPFFYWGMIISLKRVQIFLEKYENKFVFLRKNLFKIVFFICLILGWKYTIFIPNSNTFKQHKIINQIRVDAKISAQSSIIPHLRKFKTVYLFPNQKEISYKDSDIILLNNKLDTYPLNKEEYNDMYLKLKNSKDWKIIYDDNEILLLKK